jgi:hypothetical protein
MPEIKVTDAAKTWIDAMAGAGLFTWKAETGIEIPVDVRVVVELLHEVAASATINVTRQGGRLVGISLVPFGSKQVFEELEGTFDAAVASHDDLKEGDVSVP